MGFGSTRREFATPPHQIESKQVKLHAFYLQDSLRIAFSSIFLHIPVLKLENLKIVTLRILIVLGYHTWIICTNGTEYSAM